MRDDDAGECDGSEAQMSDVAPRAFGAATDIFGDYNVVGPGVQIVLDGRAVSSPNR